MKRILSVLLALVMVIGMLPMSILTASAAAGTYQKVTNISELSAGSVVVFTCEKAGTELTGISTTSTKYGIGTAYTGSPKGTYTWTVEAGNTSNTYAFKGSTGSYMNWSSGNSLTVNNKLSANTSWKITIDNSGNATLINSSDAKRQIMWNKSSPRFATYDNTKNSIGGSYYAVQIYKLVVEEPTPGETECAHANTVNVDAVAAACTEIGYTAGVYCNSCETYIEGHDEIPALGHSYGDWVVDSNANCTEAGSRHQTCANCNDVKTEAIPATGHTYENGACNVCGAAVPAAVASLITTAEQFTSGEYILVVSSGYAMGVADKDTSWVTAVKPAVVGNEIVDAAGGIWTLTVKDSSVTIKDANGVFVAPKGGNNNGLKFNEYFWTWAVSEDGTFTFAGVDTDTVRLASNTTANSGDNQFRGYKTTTIDGSTSTYLDKFCVYKVGAGEVEPDPDVPTEPTDPVEPTDPSEPVETEPVETEPVETEPVETEPVETEPSEPSGEHAGCDIAEVEAKEPTCTEDGNTAGKYCNDCDEYFDGYEVIPATGHNYVNGTCANCGEADPNVGTDENANIVFELGANGDAVHADGSSKTTYTETVGAYTLDITATDKMYTGAFDAKGNSCIKLGKSGVVGGFTIAVPDNVTSVVISVAGYKAKTVTVKVNGESYALTTLSDNGEYTAITVDTRTTKTVKFETTTTGYRAMVNSIEFVVSSGSETGHTCVWDEGTVTTAATCLAEGVMTYNCTVEGCEMYKTEAIAKTGHDMVNGICSVCNAEYYTLSTTLNNNDSVIIYYPTSKVAMSAAASNKGLAAANVTIDESGMLTNSDVAIMQVQYMEGSETDFYLICDGKYLTSAATGNGLSFADSASEYAVWYIEVVEGGNSTVFIHSRNAKYNGSSQSMEFYSGFTTYGTKTTEIYQFQLYTKGENDIACEHSWSEWEIVTAATCTTAGEQKSVCANCGDEKVQTIAATGHTYNFGDEAVTCAACDLNVAKAEIVNVPKTADSNAYYVEGVVTFVDGGTVYIQDATGGVALRLGNDVSAPAIGTKVEAIGNCSVYNGLIQLQEADFEAVSSDNTVEAQEVTLAQLKTDTELAYLSEKVSLQTVMVQSIGKYNSTYKNIDYTVSDGTNTIVLYRTPLADEANKLAVGDVINVIGVVGTYNGYQIRVVNENDITKATVKITHISLDAGKDALGFKAELNGIDPAEVTSYGFEFTVNGRTQVFKLDNALNKNDITARIYKIMGSKGGEKIITGRAFVVVNGVEISSESQSTSMKDTIVEVNKIFTTLSETQKAAVYGLYIKNEYNTKTIAAWLGETNNIEKWAPATEQATPAV